MRSCHKSIIREFTKIGKAIEDVFNEQYSNLNFKTNVEYKDNSMCCGKELGIMISIYDKATNLFYNNFYIQLCRISKPPLCEVQYIIRRPNKCDVICDRYSTLKKYFVGCAELIGYVLSRKIERNDHLNRPITNPIYT